MEITLSDSKSAIIPAEIAHEKCKVLIEILDHQEVL